jgi:hypothetical protein
MECGDKVKVSYVDRDKEMNLWGGYDDVTLFVDAVGTIKTIYDKGKLCERYGIEFEDYRVQITRERTGLIFSRKQLEVIN